MAEEENEPGLGDPDNSSVPATETTINTEASSQSPWGDLSDDDRKLVEDKGWKSPLDTLKSYREMEKLSGAKVSVPADDDEEGWSKFYARLGRPEAADKYELEAKDVDQPFMDGYKKTCFENGLKNKQAENLYNWWKGEQEAVQNKLNEEFEAQAARDQEEVRAEWGDKADQNEELMKRGYRMLNLDEDALANIETALGTKRFMQIGFKLGSAISEDTAKGLGGSNATKTEELSGEEYFKQIFEQK